MISTLAVQSNFSLRAHNSFGVDALAHGYLAVQSIETLKMLRSDAEWSCQPRLVLGGGSNLLLTRDFDGLVLHLCNRGIELLGADADANYVRASAGESWHGLVEWTLNHGFAGLENLSLIPGSVGAAPIQNIGAYGVEVGNLIHQVYGFDVDSGRDFVLEQNECEFGYRDSVFKHQPMGAAVVLSVTFALPKKWQPSLGYVDVAHELEQAAIHAPSAAEISRAVIAIRTRKLPDPVQLGNAGSFFKNPIVSTAQSAVLRAQHPHLVSYAQPDGNVKLAAGWLIDQCGWKGKNLGAAGVYAKQALVLVNRGGATGADIVRLAQAIQADVQQRFGVALEPEPVFV